MEGRRRSRRDERRDETRRELIEAAAAVFAERGYHGASLQRIARDAGYTTGAIYFHFGGKDGLFLAAFEAFALDRVAEITEIHERAPGGPAARARAMADHWMARHEADPAFLVVGLEFFVHALRHPHLREQMAARHAAVRLAVARMLEQDARAAGIELPVPAEQIATAIREMGVGLAQAKLLDPEAFSNSLYGDVVELFYERLFTGAGAAETTENSR